MNKKCGIPKQWNIIWQKKKKQKTGVLDTCYNMGEP